MVESLNAAHLYLFRYLLCLIIFKGAAISLMAQTVRISGALKTNDKLPVAGAIVMVKDKAGKIITFTSSENDGAFRMMVTPPPDTSTLFLEVNCLGYRQQKERIIPGKVQYLLLMEADSIRLQEVRVKHRPDIRSVRDTLTYGVNSFSQQQDRTIGDVLKRMPGIEMAENGQISFNGKPIYNLYIGGDDLLDGRYNLGTRTIPKDAIKSVEVLENYQPLKVLSDKSSTGNVALNLVIRDEAGMTLAGQAVAGLGLPAQYDIALNTILFRKTFKMLNALMFNNTGVNYLDDLNQLGVAGLLDNPTNAHPQPLLSAGTAGNPDLPHRNYYLNQSGMLNANNLYNLKNGLQLKSNVQIFADRNRFNYFNGTDYYTAGDTIRYREDQQSIRKVLMANAVIKATMNKESYFFNNDLRINYNLEYNDAQLAVNGAGLSQQLRSRIPDFSNSLRYTPALANHQVLDFNWYFNYYNNPQRLTLDQGLNAGFLNNGRPYQGLEQRAAVPTWFGQASAAYRLNTGKIRQQYLVGIINERQQLNSRLSLSQSDGTMTPFSLDAGNALHWKRDQAYASAIYEWKRQNLEWVVNFPVNIQRILYSDQAYSIRTLRQRFFFNPNGRVKYFTNSEDFLQLNYNINSNVGNITGVYRGLILTNYRSFQQNDTELQEQASLGGRLFYNFQRSLQMLFINAELNYTRISANTIPATVLSETVQRTILLPFDNKVQMLGATLGISKYLFALRATTSLKMAWNQSEFNQILNQVILPFQSQLYSVSGSLEAKAGMKVTLLYNFNNRWTTNRQMESPLAATLLNRRLDQTLTLRYAPAKNWMITPKSRYIYSRTSRQPALKYLFTDLSIRYKINPWKADLDLNLTNLGNIKSYDIYQLTFNRSAFSSYDIRGRMLVASLTFNL